MCDRALVVVLGGLLLAAGTTACGGRGDRLTRAGQSAVNGRETGRTVTPPTITPLDQPEAPGDRAVTQRLRQAVVADSSLSDGAKTVKIVTAQGIVTVTGSVQSEAEQGKIVALARQAADGRRVADELDVTPVQ
jgi:osmotically-inducible protein OsmY